ncbi:ABC transporter ATP-binding protein [Haloterrigena alkaliphila]|uniref:ABC-type D-xylose/L-arabinose transporter n=1 Tax=Haloterrigena alkaliphila TaxID=2816475 RepID=A0A8A2VRL4_9EURY|nr:sn-glycerol-3-phosphate ABC transporter ATP-binding protein UgpC [Haloterrigena alkaliphila]QSX00699.1 sn-glycerol-3-phosphate ABC transporter ATP-binding protein UgpC [Haloterrigena alkaliphila]
MTEVTIDGVTKTFQDSNGEIVAVDDVTIEIEDGEFLVLVGPSGCGKSTTLRMVAGLETVTDGSIRLDGRSIEHRQPKDRNVAMVFQSYALYPHMTVRENMRFGLEESTDLGDEEMDRLVEESAEMMGIGELLDRKPSDLSGGQQQRVALGRAIVRDPDVFLMDEPLSNLDAKLRSQMRTELQRIQEELGVTTIYVTHDQTEAMTMSDRIAVLNDGRLMQVGTPLECYHRPANRFVADFIGDPSMNFVDVTRRDDALVTTDGGLTYPLAADVAANLGDATDLVLGVRPEDVEIDGGSAADEHTVAATIDVIEPTGDDNVVYLDLDDVDLSLVATVDGMRRLESGDEVTVGIPEDAIHVFDRATGEALHNRRLEEDEIDQPAH